LFKLYDEDHLAMRREAKASSCVTGGLD